MGTRRRSQAFRATSGAAVVAACLLVFVGIAGGQCVGPADAWQQDQLGFAYRDIFRDGRWQRVYRDPIRQAVAWQIGRYLPEIGLTSPHDYRRQRGFDALGRPWARDQLGFAYYEACDGFATHRVYYQPERQAVAARVFEQLACVDWEAAVRRGVSSATVRGFNALHAPARPEDELVRSAVRDRIVEGLNHLGGSKGFQDLPRFQRLVAEGIEDAVISAFNQMDVVPQDLGLKLPSESLGGPPGASTLPDSVEAEPSPAAHPPPALADPGPVLVAPSVRQAARLPAPRPAKAPAAPAAPEATLSAGPLPAHYGGVFRGDAFAQRYNRIRLVDSGWVFGAFGRRPLQGTEFLILWLRDNPDTVEVWLKGVLVYQNCHYAEFFEGARQTPESTDE
jgi:hypothetical protein